MLSSRVRPWLQSVILSEVAAHFRRPFCGRAATKLKNPSAVFWVRCHHEERSDMRGPQRDAGSAFVGVQARDLLLPFRVPHAKGRFA